MVGSSKIDHALSWCHVCCWATSSVGISLFGSLTSWPVTSLSWRLIAPTLSYLPPVPWVCWRCCFGGCSSLSLSSWRYPSGAAYFPVFALHFEFLPSGNGTTGYTKLSKPLSNINEFIMFTERQHGENKKVKWRTDKNMGWMVVTWTCFSVVLIKWLK